MTKALPAALAKQPEAPTAVTTTTLPKAHDFAKQLEKASKPAAVKKPVVDTDAPDDAPPQPQIQTDSPTIVQMLAALVANVSATTTQQVAVPTKQIEAAAVAKATAITDEQPQVQQAIVQQLVAVKPQEAAAPPLTPLEQAVHDVLSELSDHKDAPKPDLTNAELQLAPSTTIAPPETATEIKSTAPIAPPVQPQELVSQNHAHLVIDDPNGRVVMTVAIRGSEVNVSVRASDDSTAAALARNAGSLEDAMRGRGLQLAQFDSQRDLTREQREKPMYERKATVKKTDGEQFTLTETETSS